MANEVVGLLEFLRSNNHMNKVFSMNSDNTLPFQTIVLSLSLLICYLYE